MGDSKKRFVPRGTNPQNKKRNGRSPRSPADGVPEHIRPMLATSAPRPPAGEEWAFEIKWDGVRAIAHLRDGRLRVDNRNLREVSAQYPELAGLREALAGRHAVLDGEIVAFDERGLPSFERLQGRMHLDDPHAIARLASDTPVRYVIFDLLLLDDRSLLDHPYRERRALLEGLHLAGPAWQTPAHHRGDGAALLSVSREHQLEGIVAKRLHSPYRPGARTRDWLKIKNHARQEFVIGGWLPGKGRRARLIGALLIGYHEHSEDSSALRYAGRVGTGFGERELERLTERLASLARPSSPFSRRGTQPPREARFCEPQLVAEIEFAELTRQRILRQPSYKGLRDDKPAAEVVLEQPPAAVDAGAHAPAHEAGAHVATPEAGASAPPPLSPPPARPAARMPGKLPYEVVHETETHTEIEAEGRRLRLSNREKVLYPDAGFTKGEAFDYYARVAPALLGHLRDRPVTLKRYPNGVEQGFFYQKRCPSPRPAWLATAEIAAARGGDAIEYCLANDLPSLLWMANLAALELHTSLSLCHEPRRPTMVVFDLDPGVGVGQRECCRVALHVRALCESLGLFTCVKSSGAKGIQVYLPLNSAASYEQTKRFARAVAEALERRRPEWVVSRMSKSLRRGRVLIDWSQNDPHKTTVSVYSLRARERPTISTPLHWEEVERAARAPGELELSAEPAAVLQRLDRDGELFAPMLQLVQTLPDPGEVSSLPPVSRGGGA